jgi:hypothetical protein
MLFASYTQERKEGETNQIQSLRKITSSGRLALRSKGLDPILHLWTPKDPKS